MSSRGRLSTKQLILHIGILLAVGVLNQIAGAYLLEVAMRIVNHDSDLIGNYESAYDALTSMTPRMIVYVCILAPTIEETVFRLGLIGLGRKMLPFWAVNIIQAILFGVYHGNLIQGIYAFIFGIMFGIVFGYMGGYISCLLVHMTINTFGLYGVPFLPSEFSRVIMVIIGIICAVAVGTLIWLDVRYIQPAKKPINEEQTI